MYRFLNRATKPSLKHTRWRVQVSLCQSQVGRETLASSSAVGRCGCAVPRPLHQRMVRLKHYCKHQSADSGTAAVTLQALDNNVMLR